MGVAFAVPVTQEKAAVSRFPAKSRHNAIGATLALACRCREQFCEYRNARQGTGLRRCRCRKGGVAMISPLIVPDPLTAHALKQLGFATVARVEKPVNKL